MTKSCTKKQFHFEYHISQRLLQLIAWHLKTDYMRETLYVYINKMKKQVKLQSVVMRIYGNSYEPIDDKSTSWYQFHPFVHKETNKTQYFKLLEFPTELQISEQIVMKAKQNLKGILYEVDFNQVCRNLDFRVYLLRANSNIMNLRSYCLLKRTTRQNLDSSIVLQVLEFLASLLNQKALNRQINLDNVGINTEGQLKLLDYSYYFKPQKPTFKSKKQLFRELLSQLFSPGNSQREAWQIQKIYETVYGKGMAEIVHSLIHQQDEQLILQKVESFRMSSTADNDTTLTQSMVHQQSIQQAIGQVSLFNTSFANNSETSDLKLDLIYKPTNKRNKVKICKIAFVLFILLVFGSGVLIYELIVNPKPIQCQVGQYQDSNKKCRDCTLGCLKCENDSFDQCYACKQSMFLILCDSQKQVGKCSSQCRGTLIRGNICVDPT